MESVRRVGDREFICCEEAGYYKSVDDILAVLAREKIFMDQSGGGVTFSGGEPLLQFDFLYEAARECRKQGYHTVIDTSGFAPSENFRLLLPHTDLFLFDIKHLDDDRHIRGTGVSNRLILENLKFLAGNARALAVRIPVIPGYNDDPGHIDRLIDLVGDMYVSRGLPGSVNLLPFHRIGSSKYRKFNLAYGMDGVEPPPAEFMKELKGRFAATGIRVKIGG